MRTARREIVELDMARRAEMLVLGVAFWPVEYVIGGVYRVRN